MPYFTNAGRVQPSQKSTRVRHLVTGAGSKIWRPLPREKKFFFQLFEAGLCLNSHAILSKISHLDAKISSISDYTIHFNFKFYLWKFCISRYFLNPFGCL